MSSASLSLYQIESQLMDLMAWRDNPDLTDEERATADAEIRKYIAAEVSKVDGIAAYFRECDSRVKLLKEEADRISLRAKAWEERRKRLEEIVQAVMLNSGKKKIEGRHSTLSLIPNPPSVEIAQPDMVPERYSRVMIQASALIWREVVRAHKQGATMTLADALNKLLDTSRISEPEPQKSLIAPELKRGEGVPGCRLNTESVRLKVS